MAFRLVSSTPILARTQQTVVARVRAAVPVQYANYVTASAVNMAAKPKKGAPAKAKKQSNSFRKKKTDDEDKSEGATGGASRLNEKYYKPTVPVKVEEFIPSTATKENVGKVLGLPSSVVSHIAYPTLLSEQFSLIKPAALVVRDSTVSFLEMIDKTMTMPSSQSRIVLTGEAGSGKSATLLQTVSHCLTAGWVVIYVPKASTWINSSYPYNKVASTSSFTQPSLASTVIGQVNSVNNTILSKIVTSEDARVGRHDVKAGTSLTELLEVGIKDPFAAQNVLEVLLKELGTQKEIPTLIAVDEVNHFFRPTQYLGQDGEELDPERLDLPKLFLQYISGKSSLSRGAVVTAVSNTHYSNKSEVLDIALGVKEVSPYKKISQPILSWTEGLTRIEIPNYTREEAKGVFDYYKKGDVLFDAPSETLFLNKYITSSGNPRKFFTACAKGI
ncbi:37S ribosomal protein S23 mitochondrial [Entomortierella beljakovae]|nr:37S ribosomal protein S23 mitochondrial [Entomortierella beljakovae]